MTDDPTTPRDGDDPDDVTPEQGRDLAAFFDGLVTDEPAPTVTPRSVLDEARRVERIAGRPAGAERTGRTARRVRTGLLAAAVAAVLVTGTVLAIRSGQGGQSASPSAAATSAAASTGAASPTPAASSSAAASSAPASASGSGSMSPAPSSVSESSAAGSSSMGSSIPTTTSGGQSTCGVTTSDLSRLRTVLRGTSLAGATVGVCRDPASIPASTRALAVNVRTAAAASCTDRRPACRPVAGAAGAYTGGTTAPGVRIWVYGGGLELLVVSATPLTSSQVAAIVADGRRALSMLT